jgi:hypothetical protein
MAKGFGDLEAIRESLSDCRDFSTRTSARKEQSIQR